MTLRSIARSLGMAVSAGLLVQLTFFYLALGPVWPLPQVVGGAVLLVAVGRDESLPTPASGVAVLLALAVYAAVLGWSERAWFDQKSLLVTPMTWKASSSIPGSEQAGVELQYVGAPSHRVSIASRELLQRLQGQSADTVVARVRITRDLGCLRATSVRRVAGLSTAGMRVHAGIFGADTASGSPWPSDPWWCP